MSYIQISKGYIVYLMSLTINCTSNRAEIICFIWKKLKFTCCNINAFLFYMYFKLKTVYNWKVSHIYYDFRNSPYFWDQSSLLHRNTFAWWINITGTTILKIIKWKYPNFTILPHEMFSCDSFPSILFHIYV